MALVHNAKSIVTGGMVLCLDAANPKSYSGVGTNWTDLSGRGNTGTLSGPNYFGLTPLPANRYSVSIVNGGTGNFTSAPNASDSAVFSNIFDGNNSTSYYTGSTSNFNVTVNLINPITYTSRTVSIYHATLNSIEFTTTAGIVTATTGGSDTNIFTYTNLLPAGGSITAIRFFTNPGYTNDQVVSITIDGQLLNLFTSTPQLSSYFNFDGVDDKVDTFNASSLTDMTIEMWIYDTRSSGGDRDILTYNGSSGSYTFNGSTFRTDGDGLVARSFSGVGYPPSNQWYRFCYVKNGDLYINETRYTGSGTDRTYGIMSFGNTRGGVNNRLNGRISNIRVYDRSLTAAEISQNFNALRGRYGI